MALPLESRQVDVNMTPPPPADLLFGDESREQAPSGMSLVASNKLDTGWGAVLRAGPLQDGRVMS